MDLKDYQMFCKRTENNKVSTDMQMADYALGIAGEAGEVVDSIKKILFHGVNKDNKTREEMGDLMWYLASFCNVKGWKLSDILDENIAKLKARYPDGFVEGGGIR